MIIIIYLHVMCILFTNVDYELMYFLKQQKANKQLIRQIIH